METVMDKMSGEDKLVKLYSFLGEVCDIRSKTTRNIKDQPWKLFLDDEIPADNKWVNLHYQDLTDEGRASNGILLTVQKPVFDPCPKPNVSFVRWLKDGWDDFRREANVFEEQPAYPDMGELGALSGESIPLERFEDNEVRVRDFELWLSLRRAWVFRQLKNKAALDLFTSLFEIYTDFRRDSESHELVVGNAFLCTPDSGFYHPILGRKVTIQFDSNSNLLLILDSEGNCELYTQMLGEIDGVNSDVIPANEQELVENGYHPLDRCQTPSFIKRLVHQLSPKGKFCEGGQPAFDSVGNSFVVFMKPVLFKRKKVDGTGRAIKQIIEDIENDGTIPRHLLDIVQGGEAAEPEPARELSIDEEIGAVGGEDPEILLSKMANREQLDIARNIERYSAVLVQGPPGTGKTHTIANLIGHFLSQGKTVLVASHTSKALGVLKDKIEPGLQSLCVSVLDDSKADMQKSIDGITSYLSSHSSLELSREVERLTKTRIEVIGELAATRRKVFDLLNDEYKSIVIAGKDISPIEAAQFVDSNREVLSEVIPGKVILHRGMPLDEESLRILYRSNSSLSPEDELEIACDLPEPSDLVKPEDFETMLGSIEQCSSRIDEICANNAWKYQVMSDADSQLALYLYTDSRMFKLFGADANATKELTDVIRGYEATSDWMIKAAAAGRSKGPQLQVWANMIEAIEENVRVYNETLLERIGKEICIPDVPVDTVRDVVERARDYFQKAGKVKKLGFKFSKEEKSLFERVKINGESIGALSDIEAVLAHLSLLKSRKNVKVLWDTLMMDDETGAYESLNGGQPEAVGSNWADLIKRYLAWNEDGLPKLESAVEAIGFSLERLFDISRLDSDYDFCNKVFRKVNSFIPSLITILDSFTEKTAFESKIDAQTELLRSDLRASSLACSALAESIEKRSAIGYRENYLRLADLADKKESLARRENLLSDLEAVAPEWAEAIRSRKGIHGLCEPSERIEKAWLWKQYDGILCEMHARSLFELQKDAASLSERYRNATSRLAESKAWLALSKRTERDTSMQQALEGWKKTVQKIGKGTGKKAPKLRAEARRLMADCQEAVPAWIMPIGKALESFDARKTKFDIVIVDEASQSDITSLAILYLAKKAIIVGDDKQVSPLAVGISDDRLTAIREMTIGDEIPNSHLYDSQTSLYDIAETTFKPLMLKEHFRCVPAIIGYSNKTSYDYKIKPLREPASSNLLPAVVPYRVQGGFRDGWKKINKTEANEIVALIESCMNQPEYEGKTFGVISLLGSDQAKLIEELAYERIMPKTLEEHDFLCGDAANFQGDERDVVFLSLVDSGNVSGEPLKRMGEGAADSTKKRYNVAASRAKDQLWVVYSLDAASDLKPGDMRRGLIDYAKNPEGYEEVLAQTERKSESPFEEEFARALLARGFKIAQQWPVGAYRIDMVAIEGNKRVAIECDGESFFTGEAKVRDDMERQAILERLGWKFIRIRGSEYYKAKEQTIDRVCQQLLNLEIHTADNGGEDFESQQSDLYDRIIRLKEELISKNGPEETELNSESVQTTVQSALSDNPIADVVNARDDEERHVSTEDVNTSLDSGVLDLAQEESISDHEVSSLEAWHSIGNAIEQLSGNSDVVLSMHGNKPASKEPQKIDTRERDLPEKTEVSVKDFDDELRSAASTAGLKYVDKREKGGCFWIVGGREVRDAVTRLSRKTGAKFTYSPAGSRATRGPAWYTKFPNE